jgi:6-phosphogluconolactonase
VFSFKSFSVDAVVKLIIDQLNKSSNDKLSLAIPGGRSPGPILKELSSSLSSEMKSNLSLLWVDERIVPLDHADRNDLATLSFWKEGGDLPAKVLSMSGPTENLKAACDAYEDQLLQNCLDEKIDVCLLGIGEDGHFASLFPNHPALGFQGRVTTVNDSPKPPSLRMTLSLPQIKSSSLNIVLCFGSEKGKVFSEVNKGASKNLPISLLDPDNTVWFLDKEAVTASKE